MIGRLIGGLPLLPGPIKRLVAAGFDFFLIWSVLWLSFTVRLGEPVSLFGQWGLLLVLAPLIAVPVYLYAGLYRIVVRHIGPRALFVIVRAVTLGVLIWTAAALFLQFTDLPRSVILIYWLFASITLAASRLVLQNLLKHHRGEPAAIYGAGTAAVQLAAALQNDDSLKPVFFLDDDVDLQGRNVAGLPVYSPGQFPQLQKRHHIREILIAVPLKTREERARLINLFSAHSVRVRILPLVSEMVRGAVRLSDFQAVQADDLLGRDPVQTDQGAIRRQIGDHVILVTGAGGSIGSELCRQIDALHPQKLILFDHSEHALYDIARRLSETGAGALNGARLGQ